MCVSICVCERSLSHVLLFVTLWTVAHQAPLSMEFSRQEHWSGLPFPSLGRLPNPGIKPASPALAGGFFTTEPPGAPTWMSTQAKLHLRLVSFTVYKLHVNEKIKNAAGTEFCIQQ